jgi:LPXTG-motif cell wall-anchored protein
VVHWQIISGTFTGTNAIDLKVKGPHAEETTCQITNTAPTGTCAGPLNVNSGKPHVDFVDECPGSTTAPPVNPAAGGVAGAVGGSGGANGGNGNGRPGRTVAGESGSSPSVASVAATAVAGSGELPVTGFAVVWLLLSGAVLLSGGALVRTRLD